MTDRTMWDNNRKRFVNRITEILSRIRGDDEKRDNR